MEDLQKTPFLILGNKIDHPNAVSEDQLRHELGLYQTTGKGKVPLWTLIHRPATTVGPALARAC